MKTTTALSTVILLLVALPALAQDGSGEQPPTRTRVVTVITDDDAPIEAGGSHNDEDFVIMNRNGEPVQVHSAFFFRGGYLGVQLTDLTPELRRHFGVDESSGIMISGLSEGGPAGAAGVRVGDIITSIDGESIADSGDLARVVRSGEDGQVVELEVWRDRQRQILEVTLAERDRPQIDIGPLVWEEDMQKALETYEVYLDKLPKQVIQIDKERIGRMLEEVEKKLQSGEWQGRIHAIVEERQLMEERIHDLEEHLRELEKRLEKLDE
jgi:hypothetical protein